MMGAHLLAAFGFIAAAGSASAAENATGHPHSTCTGAPREIIVRIVNVRESAGLMTAELYRNDPGGFLNKTGRETRVRFAAKAPATEFCITAPAVGQWSIVAYHDQNANQKFDKTSFGLPAEPYGISQNPKIRLGPPPIEKTLFEVAETGATVEISLRE